MTEKVFPKDKMTSRERMLAAYRGEKVDRLPYWVKIANGTWLTNQPENVRNLQPVELIEAACADGLFGIGGFIRETRPHVSTEIIQEGKVTTRVMHTPDGDLIARQSLDETTNSWHPTEFPIKTRDDIVRMMWNYTDTHYEIDEDRLADAQRICHEIGRRGVTHVGCGTSPMMRLVENIIGPTQIHYMLADFTDEIEELLEIMGDDHLKSVRLIASATPTDILVSTENTSTTLISPHQFDTYCYEHLCETGRIVESAGKMLQLHMCGHTLALLDTIDSIPASSIEAFTSPTLGNTRLVDGKTRAPSKTLIGGTNVNVWLWPIEKIKQYILDELAACEDHRRIILTTAGVAPPACRLETFREIGQWLASVPVKM